MTYITPFPLKEILKNIHKPGRAPVPLSIPQLRPACFVLPTFELYRLLKN